MPACPVTEGNGLSGPLHISIISTHLQLRSLQLLLCRLKSGRDLVIYMVWLGIEQDRRVIRYQCKLTLEDVALDELSLLGTVAQTVFELRDGLLVKRLAADVCGCGSGCTCSFVISASDA